MGMLDTIAYWIYQFYQWFLSRIFSPTPPPPTPQLHGPRIGIIGAGLTGVSSAAHCIGHGLQVQLFEAGPRENLGGIWSRVNNTSSLQIHSVMYRFFPSVNFRKRYPDRKRIVEEITALWYRYKLDRHTKFSTRVEKVWRAKDGRWIINDPSNGKFDGIIAAIGTCGDPKVPHIPGQEQFKGPIYHSSELDGKEVKDQTVLIIGGGASAVEAVEFVVQQGAKLSNILARSDKWIIPRNPFVDGLLAMNIFGEEASLSWVPETLLRKFFYRDLQDLAPTKEGLFTETPMVNDAILDQIRSGRVQWLRGDLKRFEKDGILFNHREQGVPKGGPGKEEVIHGDVCIMATGFHRPSLGFLPSEVFQQPYAPPNWYLQAFPIGFTDVCANNCTYINALGTAGNIHIGIYTRFLIMCLTDPSTRPREAWMRSWVDLTRLMKSAAPGGALDYFTYSELMWWFIFSILVSPSRWKWVPFVLCGIGGALPKDISKAEHGMNSERFGR